MPTVAECFNSTTRTLSSRS